MQICSPAVSRVCPLFCFCVVGCSSLSDSSLSAIGSGVFRLSLLSLDVSHVYQLTDGCLPALQRCENLQHVNFAKCLRVTDQAWKMVQPRSVAMLTQQQEALPSGSAAALSSISIECPPLQSLDLSGCRVSDHGLRRLSLAWANAASDPHHPSPRVHLPLLPVAIISLTSLTLNGCASISDAGLCSILPLLPHLSSLSVAACPDLSDRTLASLALHTPRLRSLTLHQCVEVSDAGLCALVAARNGLHDIGLDELPLVTDLSVAAMAAHCPELTHLSLARSPAVTFTALLTLMQRCAHMQYLNCALAAHLTAMPATHPDANWQQLLRIVAKRGVQFLR